MSKLVIGLAGRAGSGKSTAAQILCRKYGIPRRPFAHPLKCMIGALGVAPEILDGPDAVKRLPHPALGGKTVRQALQTLGTEWGRNLMGENFWVDRWSDPLEELPGCVADDCRFPNEAEAIHKVGGIVIRLERPGAGLEGLEATHPSELVDGVPYDAIITNDGDRELLEKRLVRLVDWHFGLGSCAWRKEGNAA